jgi:8-oxo-dGTP pyrophosphatase MutT (NUDIX family)
MAEVDTFSTIDQQRELIEERGIRADQIDALQNFVRKPGEVGTIGPLNVQYPENDVDQWCNIAIYEYVYRAESEKTLKHGLGNVILPLPLQLQTQ